jgi:dynein heavy chain 1
MLDHPNAEGCVPEVPNPEYGKKDSELVKEIKKMAVLKILRPDRFIAAVKMFASRVLGEKILNTGDLDLLKIVEKESQAKSPLLLVSAPGFDASYKVEQLAKQVNKKYTSVAIGSPEAFELVDKAIKAAAKSGQWVLLKNVHLAPQWLTELEKEIYKLQLNSAFRLFLTMEINPKVPTTLLRASHVFVFEPPSGIKAALLRSYTSTVTQQRSDKLPYERARLHFLVSWFNSVVQERLRYTPIGWSKFYEFNESDQRCAIDCVDEWIDSMGKDRTNLDPEKIPWDALRTLIGQSVFGGKIDNEFDNKILTSLVN